MKNHLKLTLFTLALFIASSCKKTQQIEQRRPLDFNIPESVMTLPGQGTSEVYLVPQTNGTYEAAYYGEMTFGDIPHKTVNFLDGEQVGEITIIDDGQYLSIQTTGPYFTVIRPTYVGSVQAVRAQFNSFKTAYTNFITNAKNPDSSLKQPYLPNLDTYVTGDGTGQLISKGQIVMSHSSPSYMSVVSADFKPTPPQNPSTNKHVLGYLYDDAGRTYMFQTPGEPEHEGYIGYVTVTDSNNQAVDIQGFNGTYEKVYSGGFFAGFTISATIYFPNGTSYVATGVVNGD